MRLYLLRHGIAEDQRPGSSDAARALTKEGEQKVRRVVERAQQAKIDPGVILTSPLRRAVETAAAASAILGNRAKTITTEALAPSSSPERVWREIRGSPEEELMLVGHEPLFSALAAFLLGSPGLLVAMKKGALVAIDIEEPAREPHGVLLWMITPKLAGA